MQRFPTDSGSSHALFLEAVGDNQYDHYDGYSFKDN